MYRKIYSHANSIRVLMMMMMMSYEYSTTVDNSTIETCRNRGLGKK